MKRYLVFAYDTYYPGGGWEDFVGNADELVDAFRLAALVNKDHYQIIDMFEERIVETSDPTIDV